MLRPIADRRFVVESANHDRNRLVDRRGIFRHSGGCRLVGDGEKSRYRGGLFPGRPWAGLGGCRRLYFCLQHRFRARRRPCGIGSDERRDAGALRIACVVSAGARMAVRAVLHEIARLHDARVSRTPLFSGRTRSAFRHIAGRIHPHENRCRHFCGRCRIRHASAGSSFGNWWRCAQQLLDRIGRGDRPDRAVHRRWRNARGSVCGRGADGSPRSRFSPSDDLWIAGAWRMARSTRHARTGHVRSVEAACAGGRREHMGACQGSGPHGVVFQFELSVARNGDLRAVYRIVVLVHGSIHRSARSGCA